MKYENKEQRTEIKVFLKGSGIEGSNLKKKVYYYYYYY